MTAEGPLPETEALLTAAKAIGEEGEGVSGAIGAEAGLPLTGCPVTEGTGDDVSGWVVSLTDTGEKVRGKPVRGLVVAGLTVEVEDAGGNVASTYTIHK